MIYQNKNYRIISDQVGTPIMILEADSGDIVAEYQYDEFGVLLKKTGSIDIPFGFAGGIYDSETGLTRFGFRDYAANVGRFTSKDPIGFGSGETNLYSYTGDNPINRIDPTGLDWVYVQPTGEFYQIDNDGNRIPGTGGRGYSGAPGFTDDPNSENLPNRGPIPKGNYTIKPPINSPNTGPNALPLTPNPGTNTHGRNNFQIHGDNKQGNRSASQGCIILDPSIRNQIINSGDNKLRVVQ